MIQKRCFSHGERWLFRDSFVDECLIVLFCDESCIMRRAIVGLIGSFCLKRFFALVALSGCCINENTTSYVDLKSSAYLKYV